MFALTLTQAHQALSQGLAMSCLMGWGWAVQDPARPAGSADTARFTL
jgi:hypothetical protein